MNVYVVVIDEDPFVQSWRRECSGLLLQPPIYEVIMNATNTAATSIDNGHYFYVGTFKFRDFKELYGNIKGRTTGFQKDCFVVKDGQAKLGFTLRYEHGVAGFGGNERFVIELEHQALSRLNSSPDIVSDLKAYLPKLKRVGCTAVGQMARDKFYGYIKLG